VAGLERREAVARDHAEHTFPIRTICERHPGGLRHGGAPG